MTRGKGSEDTEEAPTPVSVVTRTSDRLAVGVQLWGGDRVGRSALGSGGADREV